MPESRDAFYIDGRWQRPHGSGRIDVFSPADGSRFMSVPEGLAEDVDAAVGAARRAFDDWSRTAPTERAALIQRIRTGLKARREELATLITRQMGAPIGFSRSVQTGAPIAVFGAFARLAGQFAFETRLGHSKIVREPVGVVAAITPWNYPLNQIATKVAAALAAGCTVVLKPSEVAPADAFVLAEIMHEAGVPPGVFNLVTGVGPVAGEALARHSQVDMVSFTGSVRAGRRVSELAAATIKRVALELGGKSAGIVLDGADFATAIPQVVRACMANSGQTCSALTRLLVPESRYAEAAERAVDAARALRLGDPMDEATRLGPLAYKAHQARVLDYIRTGIAEGAECLLGGAQPPDDTHPEGYFVAPTVFGRVAPAATIAQEEIFGPVLTVLTFRDTDEAVAIANDSPYGLAGGVWAEDDASAEAVARRLRTGQVGINNGPFNIDAPFGGYKHSGNGRELGQPGLEEFLEYKAMQFPLR
ncbi:aldehyde dehydrogenase family protein [Nitrogeniibacter mangrovi]|uniref:Aldehyde dehydrogenase family protein n=1 Tax=Nitrogeniibacter mangrovi TaxID=2016596 RepID=A0A6C1B6S8_9RHOO|nr:aldehyde dehydrogenase family protein [Nitrogeniibacter mangrovi]QID18428.1 aldehyde dehydrogenase family protein [Nitrogeniibacter mangrovi]